MNARQTASLILAALVATVVSACSPQPSPGDEMAAVNEENCKPERIATIKDKGKRDRFEDLCVRRNTFKPSPKKTW